MDGVLSHSIKILIKYPYQVRDEINKSTQMGAFCFYCSSLLLSSICAIYCPSFSTLPSRMTSPKRLLVLHANVFQAV